MDLQRREIVDYGLNVSQDQRPYVLATNILDWTLRLYTLATDKSSFHSIITLLFHDSVIAIFSLLAWRICLFAFSGHSGDVPNLFIQLSTMCPSILKCLSYPCQGSDISLPIMPDLVFHVKVTTSHLSMMSGLMQRNGYICSQKIRWSPLTKCNSISLFHFSHVCDGQQAECCKIYMVVVEIINNRNLFVPWERKSWLCF